MVLLKPISGAVGIALFFIFVDRMIGSWSALAVSLPLMLWAFREEPHVSGFFSKLGLNVSVALRVLWTVAAIVVPKEAGVWNLPAGWLVLVPVALLVSMFHKRWRGLVSDRFFSMSPLPRVALAALVALVFLVPFVVSVHVVVESARARSATRSWTVPLFPADPQLDTDAAPVEEPSAIAPESPPAVVGMVDTFPANESTGSDLDSLRETLESQISVWEFYPRYEWPLTPWVPSNDSQPVAGRTLVAAYDENRDDYRITPLMQNLNEPGLIAPIITIRLPLSVRVRPTRFWNTTVQGGSRLIRSAVLLRPANKIPSGVNESLFLGFPQPGRYPVEYEIAGDIDGVDVYARGSYTLELVEPTP